MGKLSWDLRACGVFFLLAMAAVTSSAQTFTVLHSFDGTDGSQPSGPVLQASDGDLYGTTFAGGTANDGTVFEMSLSGSLTTLQSFVPLSLSSGSEPYSGLIQGHDGNLYGTTQHGGISRVGTVFKISTGGALKTLASFDYSPQGAVPYADLVQAGNGNFYGTTPNGGTSSSGTAFMVSPFGMIVPLYTFGPVPDNGAQPIGGLILASNGLLYGTTTSAGGRINCGTLFEMTLSGQLTTVHSFTARDGCFAWAPLVQGSDGNLYGTTLEGGTGYGNVFKSTLSGTVTSLYSFCAQRNCPDGSAPEGALIEASDGNFYGTTESGGANGYGTIFKITPTGTLTTLYSFCSQSHCLDGAYPTAGLILASNGTFYGTTKSGGAHNDGTVFSLAVELGPRGEMTK